MIGNAYPSNAAIATERRCRLLQRTGIRQFSLKVNSGSSTQLKGFRWTETAENRGLSVKVAGLQEPAKLQPGFGGVRVKGRLLTEASNPTGVAA